MGTEYGIYLSPRRQYARRYGRQTATAFVRILKPLVVGDKGEISPRDLTAADIAKLRRKGYDGIVVQAPSGPAQEIVAFDRSQVWVTELVA